MRGERLWLKDRKGSPGLLRSNIKIPLSNALKYVISNLKDNHSLRRFSQNEINGLIKITLSLKDFALFC